MSNILASAALRVRLTLADLAGPRPASWVISAVGVLLAMTAGYLIPAMGVLAIAGCVVAVIGGWLTYVTFFGSRQAMDVVFLGIVLACLLLPSCIKTIGVDLFPYVQLVFFVVSLSGLRTLFAESRQDQWLRAAIVIFCVYMAVGAGNSLLGRSVFMAAAYQFVSNLKPFLLVTLGYGLAWAALTERIFWGIVRWSLLPNFMMILGEWFAPTAYFAVFPSGSSSMDPSGIFPTRAVGIFEHPAVLANLASLLLIVTVARVWHVREERSLYVKVALGQLLVLICTAQRGELAAVLLAGMIGVLQSDRIATRIKAWIAGGLLMAGCVYWVAYSTDIVREAFTWGIGSLGGPQHPRAQLFAGAVEVSSWNPPFGAGLGTYGGAGAEKFDVTLYDQLGFERYWWYLRENFLMDTYWPNSLAETGYLGALLLLCVYLLLGVYGARKANRAPLPMARAHWVAASCGIWYMLGNSLSSPAFQDPRLFLLAAVNFGIAAQLEKRR